MSESPSSPSKDYFDKIPVWDESNLKASFDILTDETSGRIPTTRVEHWRNFETMLRSPFFNRPGTQLVYRGHRRYDWSLTPTLGRLDKGGVVSETLAQAQLDKFRKAIRGRIDDRSLLENDDEKTNDELWAVGQHHGLMTPLLDWTYSPFVSLFFAFAGQDRPSENQNPYRAVYVLNKSFVSDDEQCPNIRVIEPRKDDHGRLVNQAGLFTLALDVTIENELENVLFDPETGDEGLIDSEPEEQPGVLAYFICKIYIKNEDREGCLKHLRRMNVHHASLFPDLIGAAEYCNVQIEEDEAERKSDEARKKRTAEEEKSEAQDEPETKSGVEPKVAVIEAEMPIELKTKVSIEGVVVSPLRDEIGKILTRRISKAYATSGRIPIVVDEIVVHLGRERVVDWARREPILAKMRLRVRKILRDDGYPASILEQVVNEVVECFVKHLGNRDT